MRRILLLKITLSVILLAAITAGCAVHAPPLDVASPVHSGMRVELTGGGTKSPSPGTGSELRQPTPDAAKPYTIAWISDTQYYARELPNVFFAMTKYIQENREKLNIGYVIHTGDIVDSEVSEEQWLIAQEAMDALSDIPYGVLAGNHDVGQAIDYRNFRKYFGESKFASNTFYGGSLKDNRCHYDLITLGQTEYVFVYLGFQPAEQSMAWANQVFSKYRQRVGVLCVHEYLDTDLSLLEIGILLQEQVVKPNPNVYLVLCGHRYAQDCVKVQFDDDLDGKAERTVFQCIANFQDNTLFGGNGYMRFISVDEANGVLRFYSFSPILPDVAISQEAILPVPWK